MNETAKVKRRNVRISAKGVRNVAGILARAVKALWPFGFRLVSLNRVLLNRVLKEIGHDSL